MPVIPDGMRIYRALDTFRFHGGQGGRKNVIAAFTGFHPFQQQILHSIGVFEGVSNTGRRFLLPISKDIAHMLCIGIEAHGRDTEIDVQHVATINRYSFFLTQEAGAIPSLAIPADRGMKPEPKAHIIDLLTKPPDHIFCGCFSGRDDFVGKGA